MTDGASVKYVHREDKIVEEEVQEEVGQAEGSG